MTDITDTPLWKYQHSKPKRGVPWQLLTGVALGGFLGVLLATPLIGTTLPDSSATMIGSALGAFVAVAGAFWVLGHEARGRRRAMASAMVAILMRLDKHLEDWRRKIRDHKGQQDYGPEIVTARDLAARAEDLTAQLFPALCELDYRSVRVVIDLQMEIREFQVDTAMDAAFHQQGTIVTRLPQIALETMEPLKEAVHQAHDHFCFVSAER